MISVAFTTFTLGIIEQGVFGRGVFNYLIAFLESPSRTQPIEKGTLGEESTTLLFRFEIKGDIATCSSGSS